MAVSCGSARETWVVCMLLMMTMLAMMVMTHVRSVVATANSSFSASSSTSSSSSSFPSSSSGVRLPNERQHLWYVIAREVHPGRKLLRKGGPALTRSQRYVLPLAGNEKKLGFSEEEKKKIVVRHNEIRRQLNSSNVLIMRWNSDLENLAQDWANTCSNTNRPQDARKTETFDQVGENDYSSSSYFGVEDFISNWLEEKWQFNYSTLQCGIYYCERYKQMVWANATNLGCGITFCPQMQVFSNGGYRVICNYGPMGVTPGILPYKMGSSCSACPSDYPLCLEGLCASKSSTSVANVASVIFLRCCLMRSLMWSMWTHMAC